ncbi:MAG: nicotinate (nicotinamide) nucleotide adenylyltransferase [Erysipelotrichaceae bacterium]|nr:nicotinate (nicotinamide) nucleotide adenylyltransferase [Erysipelotrichaceae bacterium]
MKIGLLGGSFDPIHYGHIHIAKIAMDRLHLDEVWFLPTIETPLKEKKLTDFSIRCKMVKMMLKPYRKFKLSLIETKNTVPSYTINTAERLRRMYPNDEFFFIIGTDQLLNLHRWKESDRLQQLLQFVCIKRSEQQAEDPDVIMIDAPVHPASSTAIRNGDFRFIPDHLKRFIMDHDLYQETIARSFYDDGRWIHVESVADLAREIAKTNGIDPDNAYKAGLFHDCTKRFDDLQQQFYMDLYATEEEKKLNKAIWHQVTGAVYMKKVYRLEDKEIFNAIRHHTTGDLNQKLSRLIYVCDKLDPSRGYDSSETIELCRRDLDLGYAAVVKQQHDYLVKTGVIKE